MGRILAANCLLTGLALTGYTLVPQWWLMVLLGVLGGLGAGAIDAGLNPYNERMLALPPSPLASNRDVTARVRALFSAYATGARQARWSSFVDVGSTRIIMADDRGRRDVRRRMLMDDDEWSWFQSAVRTSNQENLLIVFSLPFLLPEGMYEAEAASEASGKFPWSLDPLALAVDAAARLLAGKSVRGLIQGQYDLEHWPAFADSFDQMLGLLEEIATGPATKNRPAFNRFQTCWEDSADTG